MATLLLRRLLGVAPLLLVVSFVVFLLIALAPGDPAARLAGDMPTAEQVEVVRRALRLDDALPIRYARWLWDVLQGDFGRSLATTEPVVDLIARRFPVTLSLTVCALLISTMIGTLMGVVAGIRQGRPIDRVITLLASLGLAMPAFWLGLILVISFAVERDWFPALGYTPLSEGLRPWLRSLALPATTLAILPAAELALQVRASLTEVLAKDYVVAARARGLSPTNIVLKHALKNAAIPVVTVLGFRIAQLLGGAVIIESIFVLNGLGTLAISASLASDMPVLLGLTMLTTLVVISMNFLVDASYLYFNPKGRQS